VAHTAQQSEIREMAASIIGDGSHTPESDKLDQAVVLYFTQAQLDQAHSRHVGASCDKCMMYVVRGSKCMGVYKPWDPTDTAVLGVKGVCANMFPGDPHFTATAMPTMPRDVVGYTERGPTYCGDCTHPRPGRPYVGRQLRRRIPSVSLLLLDIRDRPFNIPIALSEVIPVALGRD